MSEAWWEEKVTPGRVPQRREVSGDRNQICLDLQVHLPSQVGLYYLSHTHTHTRSVRWVEVGCLRCLETFAPTRKLDRFFILSTTFFMVFRGGR